MKKCLVKHSAMEAIKKASLPASEAGKETGGILIGPSPTHEFVMITSATGPGLDEGCASAASWETAPDYLNTELRKARDEDPRVNLRGFWHLHPGRMTHPSAQDLSEAQAILQDTEHYKLNELVMPIITADQDEITINFYYISRDDPCFREMPMEIVSDTVDSAKSLASESGIAEMETGSGFWHDAEWQFYMSAYGAARLELELNELEEAGYEVTAVLLLDDGDCCIQVCPEGSSEAALFLLPREFPLNPPRVFMKSCDEITEQEMGAPSPLSRWSSGVRLSELMEGELGEQLGADSHNPGLPLNVIVQIGVELKCDSHSIMGTLHKHTEFVKPNGRNENGSDDPG